MEIALLLFIVAIIFIVRAIKVVPQQNAWVKERLGKYAGTLTPGLNFLVPFIDRVAQGYPRVVTLANALRAGLCLLLAFHLRTVLFFPEALAVLRCQLGPREDG